MAHIDNLIDAIKDSQLRVALHAEYDKVTKNRRLGLVFDRHLPESVILPSFKIRDGEKVQILAEGTDDPTKLDGSGIWTVVTVGPEAARLRDGSGDSREVPTCRLLATREFGDPIYPGLISTGRILRGGGTEGDDGGKPFHTVINAENYHGLEALLFAHEGQVDAIYIDPPYNTGARDWKYNNDYVDDADPYRHSKWLSFMERRLLLAKRLLNPAKSGLIVTIDEKEVHGLGLLLNQIFKGCKIQMISSVINPKGVARSNEFSRTNEYVFFVFIGDLRLAPERHEGVRGNEVPWQGLRRSDIESARGTSKGGAAQFYPIYVNQTTGCIEAIGEALPHGKNRSAAPARSGCAAIFPVRDNGTEMNWGLTAPSLRRLWGQGYVKATSYDPEKPQMFRLLYLTSGRIEDIRSGRAEVVENDQNGAIMAEYVNGEGKMKAPTTLWSRPSHNAQIYGRALLEALLPGRTFPFPKSLYAVEDALRFFVKEKRDALVIDFFAGSGTTAHAVMRLNRQDDGRRRTILVTNNEVSADEQQALRGRGLRPGDRAWEEVGICEYITKPRLEAAVTGRTPAGRALVGSYGFVDETALEDGLSENVEHFTLSYEDPALVSLGRRFEAVAPLLWIRAGAVGERIGHVTDEGWTIPSRAVYGVLFDTTAWGAFVTAASRRDDLVHAFLVTDSLVEYQQIVTRIKPQVKTTRLYADYLRSFEVNARV